MNRQRTTGHRAARRAGLLGAAAVLAFVATACGSDDDDADDAGDETTATATASDSAEASATAEAATAAGSETAAGALEGTVFYLMPNATTPRYVNSDAPAIEAALAEHAPGMTLELLNAEGDPQKQVQQAETAISRGAKAIILTAADPNLSAGVLEKAAEAGVPVIAYEHEALNGPLDYFVVFSPYSAGKQQAEFFASQVADGTLESPVKLARLYGNAGDNYNEEMLRGQNEVLQPLIDDGTIEVVCEDNVPQWDPAEAQSLMEQCLTKTQNDVTAVLGFYDGITAGAIAAMEPQGLAGVVPVYGGQNPELSGLQYMLKGYQVDNIAKPFSVEAEAAVQLVVAAITGQEPPAGLINEDFDNGFGAIPTASLAVTHFLVDGIQSVDDEGIFSWEEICTGPAEGTEECVAQLGG